MGTVATEFPGEALPENRNYETEVVVGTGYIRGRYLLGQSLSLKVGTGNISAEVVPAEAKKSWLATEVGTGHTNVRFKGELGVGRKQLRGTHKTGTGHMDVVYPADFEGTLTGSSDNGWVRIGGGGVAVQEKRQQLLDMTVKGAKGVGIHGGGGCVESRISIGNISLLVGQ